MSLRILFRMKKGQNFQSSAKNKKKWNEMQWLYDERHSAHTRQPFMQNSFFVLSGRLRFASMLQFAIIYLFNAANVFVCELWVRVCVCVWTALAIHGNWRTAGHTSCVYI